MTRIITFANVVRWTIGSAIAGATASAVTLAVADYVVDERARRIEAAIEDISTDLANLEESLPSGSDETPSDEGVTLVTELRDITSQLREATAELADSVALRRDQPPQEP